MSQPAPKNAAAPAPEEDLQAAWDLPLGEIGGGPAAATADPAGQVPNKGPDAGPQHLYTGLLGMAPIQAVAYAPPPEPPKRSLACVLVAAFGVLMGLILFYLVMHLALSIVTEHEVSTVAATNSVESIVHHVRRRSSRPRHQREDLLGASAEPPVTSTTVTTSEAQGDEDPGKQSASSDGATDATSKETARLN
ncbi:hypothetical protein HPB52_015688 [Rhipicephalus sanguineus]|uniref:Uncharacterized protein n=1 Tax=Rhipicephalus sanguineus TaxID=34632 RepID=A0A9D4Q0P2_RHISA|nr:hypothetical protein HPB52_015688 [Rhipicephalus sanguineus]